MPQRGDPLSIGVADFPLPRQPPQLLDTEDQRLLFRFKHIDGGTREPSYAQSRGNLAPARDPKRPAGLGVQDAPSRTLDDEQGWMFKHPRTNDFRIVSSPPP